MVLDQILDQVSDNHIIVSSSDFDLLPPNKRQYYIRKILELSLASGNHLISEGKNYALIQQLPFDSNCFGKQMGKLSWIMVSPDDSHEIAGAIIMKAKQLGFSHINIRLDTKHMQFVQALEHNGFYFVDTQVTMSRSLLVAGNNSLDSEIRISHYQAQDLDNLQNLSVNMYRLSRLYADPNLLPKSADEFHRRWIENDCNGRADIVLVARRSEDILGYIACLFRPPDPELKLPARSEIDLIAVSMDAQGQGIGTALVWAALIYYSDRAERIMVETQGSNFPAINLYAKCGFRWETLAATLAWSAGDGV